MQEHIDKAKELQKAAVTDQTTQILNAVKRSDSEAATGKKPTWQPAERLGLLRGYPDGYTPRWVRNSDDNVQKKLDEGWVLVNKTQFAQGREVRKTNSKEVTDGSNIAGVVQHRELIGMALPPELKAARDEYHREETRRQTMSRLRLKGADVNQTVVAKGGMTSTIVIN